MLRVITKFKEEKPLQFKSNGTMILRHCGNLFKVSNIHSYGNKTFRFECQDIATKEEKLFQFILSGLLEAVDYAFKVMRSSKDIFFLDLEHNQWDVYNIKN